MTNTWGISGPTFLLGYAVLAALVAVIAFRLRGSALAERPSEPSLNENDPTLLAYLSGGPARALQTAVVRLRLSGRIEPTIEPGRWVLTTTSAPTTTSASTDGVAARPLVRIERHGDRGHVAELVLDRPAAMNAVSTAMAEAIDEFSPDLVVLAGFMRILSDGFVQRYAGRLVNIHPSLLPSFPGLHTHRRALEEGVRVHGCTVHFVTPALDHGPIILQAAVPVLDGDDEATLAARVLAQEHQVYPLAVRWFAEDRLRLRNGRVEFAAAQDDTGVLIAPRPRRPH